MPTAKKLYTFNETIVKTGLAIVTSEEEMNEYVADEGNYITFKNGDETAYLLPFWMNDGETEGLIVYACYEKAITGEEEIVYAEMDGTIYGNFIYGVAREITDMGNLSEWVFANTTTDGLTIPIESPNGVQLLLNGKLCVDDIVVVPNLVEQEIVTPTTETQTISAPEGYAGFKSFIVDRIPSDYVPEGYVPEGTVPEGYVKPEGELVLTENVTGMDISGKATLTTNISTHEEYEGEVIIDG